MPQSITEWHTFFATEAGAAATLIGLVTVAISINLARILDVAHLPMRAAEALAGLTSVFALTGLALFPGVGPKALGFEAIVIAALWATFAVVAQSAMPKGTPGAEPGKRLLRGSLAAASLGPIIFGGVLMSLGRSDGIPLVAMGVVLTLAASVFHAWVLLIEIMR